MDNHSKVFETPKGLPPIHDHDHSIHFILGIVPLNIRPYKYPYAQKSEIECIIAEMLEAGIIQPNQSSFSTPSSIDAQEGWVMAHVSRLQGAQQAHY